MWVDQPATSTPPVQPGSQPRPRRSTAAPPPPCSRDGLAHPAASAPDPACLASTSLAATAPACARLLPPPPLRWPPPGVGPSATACSCLAASRGAAAAPAALEGPPAPSGSWTSLAPAATAAVWRTPPAGAPAREAGAERVCCSGVRVLFTRARWWRWCSLAVGVPATPLPTALTPFDSSLSLFLSHDPNTCAEQSCNSCGPAAGPHRRGRAELDGQPAGQQVGGDFDLSPVPQRPAGPAQAEQVPCRQQPGGTSGGGAAEQQPQQLVAQQEQRRQLLRGGLRHGLRLGHLLLHQHRWRSRRPDGTRVPPPAASEPG